MKNYLLNSILIILSLLLTLLAISSAIKIKFDINPDGFFFPKQDDEVDFYFEYKSHFDNSDDYLTIALANNHTIFDSNFLEKIQNLGDTLLRLPAVERYISPLDLSKVEPGGISNKATPIISINPSKWKKDSLLIARLEDFFKIYVSLDTNTILSYVKLNSHISENQKIETSILINSIVDGFKFSNSFVVGRKIKEATISDSLLKEFKKYGIGSIIFTLIVLVFLFKKPLGVLILSIPIFVGMIWFFGIYQYFERTLDLTGPLMPTLLAIIGLSDIIHILIKYQKEKANDLSNKEACTSTIKNVGLSTFLTSMTTALGFASLYFSNSEVIQRFGLFMALGVIIQYISIIGFFNWIVKSLDHKLFSFRYLKNFSQIIPEFLFGKKRKVVIIMLVFSILLLTPGFFLVSKDFKIIDDFSNKSQYAGGLEFFDTHLFGNRNLEIAIVSRSDTLGWSSVDLLSEINELESFITELEEVKLCYSVASIYKYLNAAKSNYNSEYYRMPDKERLALLSSMIKSAGHKNSDGMLQFVSSDNKMGRIILMMNDSGSKAALNLYNKIQAWIDSNESDIVKYQLTGSYYLIDKGNVIVSKNLIVGLGISVIVVGIIMFLWYRQISILLLTILVNAIPLLAGLSAMGYLGIPVKSNTLIVFLIGFGIVVDDTIHFLSHFKLNYLKFNDFSKALEATYSETGTAIIVTSIILFCGFILLLFSYFPIIQTTGTITSVSVISALLMDLVLLPLGLILIYD